MILSLIITTILLIVGVSGIRIVRPTERAVIETLGKYSKFAKQGFNWVVPIFQRAIQINVTEKMADVSKQIVITKDNLNAEVDLVIFYKVKNDEESVKKAIYNVNSFQDQIITLGQTTARDVIGSMVFREVNSQRNQLNKKLASILITETKNWGVDIVRVELRDIVPPQDVQDTMNRVIKAENEKDAAKDFATAVETEADGKKRAAIKEAQGLAQGRIIVAEANAQKIKIENEAAKKYFIGNAQKLKQLETLQESLKGNSKIILGKDARDILKLLNLDEKK